MSVSPAVPELVAQGLETLRTSLSGEIRGLAKEIEGKFEERLAKLEAIGQAPQAQPENPNVARMAGLETSPDFAPVPAQECRQLLGALIRAVGAAGERATFGAIMDQMRSIAGKSVATRFEQEQQRTLALYQERRYEIGTPQSGGVFVPETIMSGAIPMLYPSAILQAIGMVPQHMPTNVLKWPRETAEGVAYWGKLEPKNVKASKGSFGEFRLEARSLTAITSFANTFLRTAGASANETATRRFVRLFSRMFDVGAIYSDGTLDAPKGLLARTSGTDAILIHPHSAAANVGLPMKMLVKLMENDATMGNLQWIMGPTLYGILAELRDGNGNLFFPGLTGQTKTLLGYPVHISTTITVKGTANNPTDLILGDWDRFVVGEHLPLEIFSSNAGAYLDSNSTMQSTISNLETAVRFHWQGDMAPEEPKCFVACTTVHTT